MGKIQNRSKQRVLFLFVILAVLVLERADAVGKAGCGSFYQESSCREDCGSCGQPCCTLEWEIGIDLSSLPFLFCLLRLLLILCSIMSSCDAFGSLCLFKLTLSFPTSQHSQQQRCAIGSCLAYSMLRQMQAILWILVSSHGDERVFTHMLRSGRRKWTQKECE